MKIGAPPPLPGPSSPMAPLAPTIARQSQSIHQSKQKLKFVEWEKIHRRQLGETIWDHLTDVSDESEEEEEEEEESGQVLFGNQKSIVTQLVRADVFASIEKAFAQKPAVDLTKRKRKVADVVELLDSRKAYNMSIFLTSLPKDFEIVKLGEYLERMQLEEHVLENLIKFAPDLEEIGKFKAYKGDKTKLSQPDQLVLHMMSIPQYKQRVTCLLFKTTFWDRIEQMEKVRFQA
jgi:hypothetical protein